MQARDFIIHMCREFYRPSELITQHATCLSKNHRMEVDDIHFHSASGILVRGNELL